MRQVPGLARVLLIMSMAACNPDAAPQSKTELSPLTAEECEAIRVAERFVYENGYTKAPATEDRSRVVWELGDDPSQVARVLEIRHDSVKPHAYGLRWEADEPLPWAVVFEPTDRLVELARQVEGKPREQPSGAVVRVKLDPDGPKARKQHTPIFLSAVKRLPSHEKVAALCDAAKSRHSGN